MARPATANFARLLAVGALLHYGFDAVSRQLPATTPPYLMLPWMNEVFRDLLSVGILSVTGSALHGAISAIFALAFVDVSPGRRTRIAWTLSLAWVGSGAAFLWVYVDAPWWAWPGSLAAGVVRSVAVAWVLERMLPEVEPAPPPASAG